MKRIISIFSVVALLLTTFSCSDLEEMNVDPNQPSSVPASNLFTQGAFGVIFLYWDREFNFEYGMLLSQHLAQNEYTEEQRYDFEPADFNFRWSAFYAGGFNTDQAIDGGMNDLAQARALVVADENITEPQRANQLAVIDIMMSFGFQYATDIWGDIPYSQALNVNEFVKPVYDSQSDIYSGLIQTVSDAVDAINTDEPGFVSGDVLFDGDMDAWQKFGNALLLRMGMRVSDVDATLAQSAVSKALGGNIISAVDEEAALVFKSAELLANPFWFDASPSGGSRDDFRVSKELIDALKGMGDPRVAKFAAPVTGGEYVGMPYGLSDPNAFALKNSTSDLNPTIREATTPACILRYSEVKLLEAQAIASGLVTTGSPADAYNAGVTASMNEWGITDEAAIASYLAANPYTGEDDASLQLWFALFTNGMEAWSTQRRTDIPALTPGPAALLNYIPRRGFYPTDEESTNLENLSAVPYDNSMEVRLWWDAN